MKQGWLVALVLWTCLAVVSFGQVTTREVDLLLDVQKNQTLTINHKAFSAIKFNGAITDSVAGAFVDITGNSGSLGFKFNFGDNDFFAESAIVLTDPANGKFTATFTAANWATNITVKKRLRGDLSLSLFGAPLPSIALFLHPNANQGDENQYISPVTATFETNRLPLAFVNTIDFSNFVTRVENIGNTSRVTIVGMIDADFVRVDGSNGMVGVFNMGGFGITNIATNSLQFTDGSKIVVDGIDIFYQAFNGTRFDLTAFQDFESMGGTIASGISVSATSTFEFAEISGVSQPQGDGILGQVAATDGNGVLIYTNVTDLPDVASAAFFQSQVDDVLIRVNRNEDNIIVNAFRISINADLTLFNLVDAIVDTFEDETGVNVTSSTNQIFVSAESFYTNSGNMFIKSENFLQTIPITNITLYLLVTDLEGGLVENVDLIGKVSKDNGLTFTQVTLTNKGELVSTPFDLTGTEVVHYFMDDNAANTVIADHLGGNDGVLNGGNTADKTTSGKILSAIDFDGTGDFVDGIGRLTDMEGISETWAVSCWFTMETVAANGNTIWAYESGNDSLSPPQGDIYCIWSDSIGTIVVSGGSAQFSTGLSDADDGLFHHIVVSRDVTTVTVYHNGVLDSTSVQNGSAGGGAFSFRIADDYNVSHLDGLIDDLRIFNRNVTTEEVRAIYNAGVGTQDDVGVFDSVVLYRAGVQMPGEGTNIQWIVETKNDKKIRLVGVAEAVK